MTTFFKHIILLSFVLLNLTTFGTSNKKYYGNANLHVHISNNEDLVSQLPTPSTTVTLSESRSNTHPIALLEIFSEEEKEEKEDKKVVNIFKNVLNFFQHTNQLSSTSLLKNGILNDSKKTLFSLTSLHRCSLIQVFII